MKAKTERNQMVAILLAAVLLSGGAFADAENLNVTTSKERPADATVTVDFAVDCGPVKPMNAVNNGPVGVDGTSLGSQHGNFATYKAARIPYARTHDTSEYIVYGGDHCVDISAVFPNFDADETKPESYDFAVTDAYLKNIRAAGTEPFFRLGQRIEHAVKKYNVYPPKDFAKWARICEHVIRHYNYGWAKGFQWNIHYWEIWNEADVDWNRKAPPRTWGGTAEQFFEFFEVVAKHLKAKFPALKIGGPAAAGIPEWCEQFLAYQQAHQTPMDFYSWHIYARSPKSMAHKAKWARNLMVKYGYGDAESILNEWNYVKGWKEDYHYSIVKLSSQKGAALVAAGMVACQGAPVDMLMYYDAMPTAHFNGMFDNTTLEPVRPYYAIYAWGRLASTYGRTVKAEADIQDIYVTAARGEGGRRAIFLVRYDDDENYSSGRVVKVKLAKGCQFPPEVVTHVTDSARLYTEVAMWPSSPTELTLRMPPQSFTMIEYVEPPPPPAHTFRVATFNIRIDTEGGKITDTGDKAWPERLPRVVKVIKDGWFDLIGFQEVTKNMWPDLVAALPEYAFADGADKHGPNPIAYKPKLFERIDSGRFALSAKPDDFKTCTWGSSSVRVCQWALLKHKATGRLMRVFNQHPDWKSQESRSKGMALVLEKAKKAMSKGEDVIMTGDLNEMIGGIVPWSPFDPKHEFGDSIRLAKGVLRDSFDLTETPHTGPVCTSHSYKPPATRRIDYIFVSDAFRVLRHHTHADRPGGKFPSDHDAVSALLGIK